ncbi:unnamed protein product [Anisakis simplex]|uniref:CUB domain-containing protein n=1 Tax=Anisakis simplex TaxID=6269 RepID=A0A3P6RRT5_ANISI|nr:unnamed protein product [Anisakis simplex]
MNFPNGLPDVGDATCTVNIQPMPGFGVRLLFEEFFIGREDSLTIQTATDEQSIDNNDNSDSDYNKIVIEVFSRHGSDTDPERGTVAFSLSPGPMSLTFQQTKPDVFMADVKHTGFKAILKPYNMSADEKTLCGGKRLIKDTYFETSFAYPEDYGEGNNCRWEFEGVNANLRILFYDFQTDDKTDSFVMSGDPFVMSGGSSTNETHNTTIHLGGYDVTSDLPVAFYFRGSVHINFTSGDGSIFPPRRFSFIIDTFADQTNDTQEVCVGAESIHDLSVEKSVMINTNNYGTLAYENYLKCQFSFINPPQHHVIYLQMAFESERCCDLMTVNGIGQDYIFQGERYPTIYFANSPNVSFEFSSDGVRKAVGFKGYVSTLVCAKLALLLFTHKLS